MAHASFKYRHSINCGKKAGLSNAANVIHSLDGMVVRELGRRCNYNRTKLVHVRNFINSYTQLLKHDKGYHHIELLAKESNFYSLVAIEYINNDSISSFSYDYLMKIVDLINTILVHDSFQLIMVHDEFKCHPNYCNIIRQEYIKVMAKIADSNMLKFLLEQVTNTTECITKYTTDLGDKIRANSNYGIS